MPVMSARQRDRHPAVRPYGRLKLIGTGVVLVLVWTARMLRGVQGGQTGRGQPMFSWGLIAAALACVLLAFIPLAWIARVGRTRSKEPPKPRAQRGICR
ncbi:hypothetical protein SBA7_1520004 [Candidatus Sulfotelmatobacter sp. SbA7]|nr:hypothetical protein SBA7_1520004 [Candidatus Sulfotelmatobacter sp. SbA7]